MDGAGEDYANWKKTGSERQITYDLTYKWNLINETYKQAKYNQRHEIKNKLSVTGLGGEGNSGAKKGKGRQWTCIKGTWTIRKWSRIEGGRWGWVGQWKVVVAKWRQVYSNINKKWLKRKRNKIKTKKCVLNFGVCSHFIRFFLSLNSRWWHIFFLINALSIHWVPTVDKVHLSIFGIHQWTKQLLNVVINKILLSYWG